MRTSVFSSLCLTFAFVTLHAANAQGVSGSAVVNEMNLARQNPALYATYVEQMRAGFDGKAYAFPGGTRIRTKEGAGALDDAIRFLRSARPVQRLAQSSGMSRGAADHCADQASGRRGHGGSGFSNPGSRMNRYGKWSGRWGENISYGKHSARDIVLALIIDDGLRSRKHRANIFNPAFNFTGAAFGPHASYRSVCSISYAAGYAERGRSSTETLLAGN